MAKSHESISFCVGNEACFVSTTHGFRTIQMPEWNNLQTLAVRDLSSRSLSRRQTCWHHCILTATRPVNFSELQTIRKPFEVASVEKALPQHNLCCSIAVDKSTTSIMVASSGIFFQSLCNPASRCLFKARHAMAGISPRWTPPQLSAHWSYAKVSIILCLSENIKRYELIHRHIFRFTNKLNISISMCKVYIYMHICRDR